ncbi:hypothetical protein RHDC4_00344 [Rhodocyclaceae bacterium]|nr:hypothetical protein RHDC4_00344 [Rhodocyclaceae bacterium]
MTEAIPTTQPTQRQPKSAATRVNTAEVREMLRRRFASPEWALMEEVAPHTGGGTRYADAVAMNLWRSRAHVLYGFEIKVSRGDWLHELRTPAKAEESVFDYCDGWYLVAPAGVLADGELPVTWGHLEVKGGRVVERVKPPKLQPKALDRRFFASLMRRGFEQLDQLTELKMRQAVTEAREKIDARVDKEIRDRTIHFQRAKEAIANWEKATGLKFDQYGGPSVRLIRLAQQLDALQMNWASRGDSTGFMFISKLADDLMRAADVVRNALADSGAAAVVTALTATDDESLGF